MTHEEELRWVSDVLKAMPRPEPPADLRDRIHLRLAAEPLPAPAPSPRRRAPSASNWGFFMAGLVAALVVLVVGARFYSSTLLGTSSQVANLPVLQTAAVTQDSNLAVQIGFDVIQDVSGVTFEVDLPEGLRFVNASGEPVQGQSVSWKGSLKAGNTVVPITLRGVQPGTWALTATVRKGDFVQKTRILIPVQRAGTYL